MTTRTSPRASFMPAITADARPALPARRSTRTGCLAPSFSATSAVPSGEPSSTTTSSHSRSRIAGASRSPRSGSDAASLYVGTIPDVAPLIWPEHYLRLSYARAGHAWQYALARRADGVIAVSEATKRDVVERLRVPEDRVTVVTEAVDESFVPPSREEGRRVSQQRFGVPDRYVLYVGQFDPRKNVRGLLRAFAQAADRDRDLRLVIAGDLGKLSAILRDALTDRRVPRDRVILTGFVDDATLAALYAGAECLIHAALLEGFGLTALESLAAGTPVVGYAGGAVAEVVGDAGLLVGSGDESALANALARFLDDDGLRWSLRGRGRARASAFSWDRAADETLSVYRKVAPSLPYNLGLRIWPAVS